MKTKHTKGPWEIRDGTTVVSLSEKQKRWNNYAGNPAIICVLHEEIEDLGPIDLENYQANARLIAAAPELLEALEELCNLVDDIIQGNYKPDGFTTQPARNAINKAT